MEYASKGLAGTALGFGIGGAALGLANGGLGNLLGGLNQNKRSEAADIAAAVTPAMTVAAMLAARQQEPTCSENMPVTRYDLDREQKLAAKDSEGRNGMVLQGPGGYLVVEGGTNALPVVYSVLGGVRGGGTRVDGPKPERHRMAYEFAEFARIIAEKDADAEAAARMRTMRVMELLDVLHEK